MNANDKCKLDENGEPVPCGLLEWAACFESSALRQVARETVADSDVSTVFLGLDHQWGDGPPLIWETMVFGGKLDQEQDRCGGTRAEALAMHARMVERVKLAIAKATGGTA
jgi:hypothetical protein